MNAPDTSAAIVDALQRDGVTLLDKDGQLLARPRTALSEDQAARIRDNRVALLAEVQKRPAFIRSLLSEMGGRFEP